MALILPLFLPFMKAETIDSAIIQRDSKWGDNNPVKMQLAILYFCKQKANNSVMLQIPTDR